MGRIDPDALEALFARAQKEAARSGCATQVAVGRDGELAGFRSFGASDDTLFAIYSVTKAVTSAAAWILLQERKLGLGDRVAEHVPEFAAGGKDAVTVEQLLVHTAGFPSARLATLDWADPERRLARFAAWPLEWEPGSRFVYHGTSSMWMLAEILTRVAGVDYRDFIRTRIFEPLGLRDFFLGLPEAENARVAEVKLVGDPPGEDRGASPVDAPVLRESDLEHANDPAQRAVGSPAGGAFATAADVAMFYQGILADAEGRGRGIWQPETIREALRVRNPELVDPMTGQPALRGLGVVLAGESGRMWRGFAEACSAPSFGHMGAGGQVSWADPESGLSFAFCTSGAERDAARQGARGFRLSTLAAACAEAGG